jgi:translocator protein
MPEIDRYAVPILFIIAPFIAGAIGSAFTVQSVTTWYRTLVLPSWTPPAAVFGPVWTVLYLLMGIAAYLAWRSGKPTRKTTLIIFSAQLVLNALWSVVFFGLRATGLGLFVIVGLWALIAWLIVRYERESRAAAWLFTPYLLWVTYAATLNLGIVLLN